MKIISLKEIQERIINKYNTQDFEIIEYTKVSKPFVIKCLKCGEIKKFSSFNNFLSSGRKFICSCYNDKNKETIHKKNKELILKEIEKRHQNFISFGYDVAIKKYLVTLECSKCKQVFTKSWQGYLKNSQCPFCENKQKMNTQGFKELLPDEYELLGEYKDQQTKILVRHKCGFIWKISPHGFLSHIGCPKCNKKRSAGEQKISLILDDLKIPYSIEVSFPWQTNSKRRYDFYLPEQNLVIEYMGEQHYIENNFFKVPLAEQQKIDKIKKEEALQNGLLYYAISYKDFKKLEDIIPKLVSSTTSSQNVGSSEPKE